MFCLQKDASGFLSPDTNTIRAVIESENEWLSGQQPPEEIVFASGDKSLSRMRSRFDPDTVPVGSLEFCTAFAREVCRIPKFNVPALNVPEELRPFAKRDFEISDNILDTAAFLVRHGGVIVKPADVAKRFDINVFRSVDDLGMIAHPAFLSDALPEMIVAEWRVFYLYDRIVELSPYRLVDWVAPDEGFVSELLSAVSDCGDRLPPSGTLDIAVLADGSNALLEMHPFCACGLYGCEAHELPVMLKRSWAWLKRRFGK